jgi:hypothetical protein
VAANALHLDVHGVGRRGIGGQIDLNRTGRAGAIVQRQRVVARQRKFLQETQQAA